MSTPDEEFIRKLQATFSVEAEEHLQALSSMLLGLEKSPDAAAAAAAVEGVYREAHSLKGAARAIDMSDVESVCQVMEEIFAGWKRGQSRPSREAFDALHQALDTIRAFVEAPQADPAGGRRRERDQLIRRLRQHQAGGPVAAGRNAPVARPTVPKVRSEETPPDKPAPDPERSHAIETVRVATARLDARLRQAEEMLVTKSLVAQRAAELRDVVAFLGQWREEWAKVAHVAHALRRDVPGADGAEAANVPAELARFLDWNSEYVQSLEARVSALAAKAERDRRVVGRQVDDLLDGSKKLLMLPFSTLTASFPRLVRDLCRDQDKEAELEIRGGEVEIDKRVLEEVKDALIHVLRNSVDHGVERPAERARQNKPARATITVAASAVNGSKVEIVITDDGAGVDTEQVTRSAVRGGLLSEAQARGLSDAEALGLVFRSEVSTSASVTPISGRGLGMAIVQSKIEKLGGKVSIQSVRHAGTTLRMLLPLTLATFRGILVAVGERTFVLPIVHVERVLRVKERDVRTAENRETIAYNGRALALVRLDRLLGLPPNPGERGGPDAPVPVVVLRIGEQRIACAVGDVLHEEEVLVKPFRKPLVRLRNIAGATVLASGKAVLVLNVADLMKSARTYTPVPVGEAQPSAGKPVSVQRVLVAEDSITSRMLLKGILESAGYYVETAVDGMDAFTKLREGQFDLLVSDVEMPRMNGFSLTAQVRADKRLSDLPIVLVTALETREDRERGVDAGANAYVVKSSFDQSNLLETVRRLI